MDHATGKTPALAVAETSSCNAHPTLIFLYSTSTNTYYSETLALGDTDELDGRDKRVSEESTCRGLSSRSWLVLSLRKQSAESWACVAGTSSNERNYYLFLELRNQIPRELLDSSTRIGEHSMSDAVDAALISRSLVK